ncbi:site-specific DNA-methyltransferase [Mycoplasmopsis mucosicanis]|uniref:Site-specific DNA-methyltransferase n=2 Tax=Mycoplasmopsis mucosicanis TaxID=458208 RepID=A0A507SQB3_9BACT|nr:site-specific DNA-methyltransferase [Mycoplasmopsis mucosicanis]
MNERLRMARQLLKEDGVIFVSIDDAEQAYLKVLMDEIFGEENFMVSFIWERTNHTNQGNTGKKVFRNSEYIHTYCKNALFLDYFNEGDKFDFDSAPLKNNSNKEKELVFKPNQIFIKEDNSYNLEELKIKIKSRWNQERVIEELEKGTKFRLTNKKEQIIRVTYAEDKQGFVVPKSLLNTSKLFSERYNKPTTEHGTKELNSLINSNLFSYPKPKELIMYLISLIKGKEFKVLDFFAGSGTTAHAVLDLNREDGGHRTYTLVTNNENNIAKDVCYERLFRINKGVGSKGEKDFDWIKKNEPYNTSLDVFNIKYFDTNLLNTQNELIKETLKQEFVDFGIDIRQMEKMNTFALLTALYSLKPVKKDEDE